MIVKKPKKQPSTKSLDKQDLKIEMPEIKYNTTNEQTMVSPPKMKVPQEVCSPSYLRGKRSIRIIKAGYRSCQPRSVVSKALSKPLPFRNHDFLSSTMPNKWTKKAGSNLMITEMEPLKPEQLKKINNNLSMLCDLICDPNDSIITNEERK